MHVRMCCDGKVRCRAFVKAPGIFYLKRTLQTVSFKRKSNISLTLA